MDHVRESSQKKYTGSINFIKRELASFLMEPVFFLNKKMWMLAGKFDFKIVFEKIQFECFDHNLIKGTEINRI